MPFLSSGREEIKKRQSAKRIVSVVPSQTELLHALGLENEVVGITKFCVHPQTWFRSKQRVGGTKNINLDTVRRLQPDLILAAKEENAKEQIEALATEFPVYVSDVHNLPTALEMIEHVGLLTGRTAEATKLVQTIQGGFETLAPLSPRPRAAYLIWKEPYMTVGGDTFIHDMLTRVGFDNVFTEARRYPEVSVAQLRDLGCDLILLSSEPYPFNQKHAEELQREVPGATVVLVDGEAFSWYGSRLLHAPAYFETLKEQLSRP